MDYDYERPPEEAYDDYEKPKPKRRKRQKAFAITRCPWCLTPIKVYDDENGDDKIEEFVALGNCRWLERNNPQKADAIRKKYYERVNLLDQKTFKGRGKR